MAVHLMHEREAFIMHRHEAALVLRLVDKADLHLVGIVTLLADLAENRAPSTHHNS
jgi:hypothetical protein